MPIFEYTCKSCGADCEVFVRRASARPACPGCGGNDLKKKLSTFAAQGTKSHGASCAGCTSTACSTCRR